MTNHRLKLINQVPTTIAATAELYIKQGESEFGILTVAGGGGTATQPTDPQQKHWQAYARVGGNTSQVVTFTDPSASITCRLVGGLPELTVTSGAREGERPAATPGPAGGGVRPSPASAGGAAMAQESASEREILDYWTLARKNNAIPKGRRGAVSPALLEKVRQGKGVHAQLPTADSVTTVVPSASLPSAPYAAVGKLFFHWDGQDYVGSAWVIGTPTLGIFTAGHNLFDARSWSSNVLFELQYDDGAFVQKLAGDKLYVAAKWQSDEALSDDLAVVMPAKAIAGGTPALAYLVDSALAPTYRGLGYPAEPIQGYRFDGKTMWQSQGDSLASADGCFAAYDNMTQGSSGGPWCVKVGQVWYANGLQSHGLDDDEVSYSPVFTRVKLDPLLKAAGLIPSLHEPHEPHEHGGQRRS